METNGFTHEPVTEVELARVRKLLCFGHVLAFVTFISAFVALWSLRDSGTSSVGPWLRTIYAFIAVFGATGWLYWSIVEPPDERRYEDLSLKRVSQLKELCDRDADANRLVGGWVKAGYTIRLRDLLVLKAMSEENKRTSILESLRAE